MTWWESREDEDIDVYVMRCRYPLTIYRGGDARKVYAAVILYAGIPPIP